MDQADLTFEVELRDGTKLKAPLAEHLRDTVLEASCGYRDHVLVSVQGIVKRDKADRYKSLESVEHITTLDPLDIETRLEDLATLQDGWLNGKGKALDGGMLQRLAQDFDQYFDTELPLPYLYPTPEGGIQAEWAFAGSEISLEIDPVTLEASYQAVDLITGTATDFDLALAEGEQAWSQLNNALKAQQEARA